MPEEEGSEVKSATKASGIGDGGLAWLKKAYQRCVEQAREEGRSLEELAAERWGVGIAQDNRGFYKNAKDNNLKK